MSANADVTPAAISIRNIRMANLAMEDTLNAIDAALAGRITTKIAFVNADCVNIAANNPTTVGILRPWIGSLSMGSV